MTEQSDFLVAIFLTKKQKDIDELYRKGYNIDKRKVTGT